MTYILLVVVALTALGIVAAITTKTSPKEEDNTTPKSTSSTCSTCDGTNSKCEQECMMEAAVRPIDYFDDEELDVFKGRPSNNYNDEEVELFAEVLYTMRPDEVASWNRSLILRGINVPDQIKDELVMMMDVTEKQSPRQ